MVKKSEDFTEFLYFFTTDLYKPICTEARRGRKGYLLTL